MTHTTNQDPTRLQQAVSDIRDFLKSIPVPLALGTVVKTNEGLVGAIIGIDAPEDYCSPWSYAVCVFNTDDFDDSSTAWYDANQLEIIGTEEAE